MYFYIDESGQTGLNLFDNNQPYFYYGVISSPYNLDKKLKNIFQQIFNILEVEELHAQELGIAKLTSIINKFFNIHKRLNINFDIYSINKIDYSVIIFFNEIFDSGINPSVDWWNYNTPLRYVLLIRFALLFDIEDCKDAWEFIIGNDDKKSISYLIKICERLLERIEILPDARTKEVISKALIWAKNNPAKLILNHSKNYDVKGNNYDYNTTHQLSPNLVGFQGVLEFIQIRSKYPKSITIDIQKDYNIDQSNLQSYYNLFKNLEAPIDMGMKMPKLDFGSYTDIPFRFENGKNSLGLQLVDIYLWIFKRLKENKKLSNELTNFIKIALQNSLIKEISFAALEAEWEPTIKEFLNMKLSEEQIKQAKETINKANKKTS